MRVYSHNEFINIGLDLVESNGESTAPIRIQKSY